MRSRPSNYPTNGIESKKFVYSSLAQLMSDIAYHITEQAKNNRGIRGDRNKGGYATHIKSAIDIQQAWYRCGILLCETISLPRHTDHQLFALH
jgi:hypothetical protein